MINSGKWNDSLKSKFTLFTKIQDEIICSASNIYKNKI